MYSCKSKSRQRNHHNRPLTATAAPLNAHVSRREREPRILCSLRAAATWNYVIRTCLVREPPASPPDIPPALFPAPSSLSPTTSTVLGLQTMSTHPYTTTAHTARRYPLATTAAPNVKPVQQVRQHIPGTPPPKHQDPQQQQKQPSSPPLPRQNAKVPPPSPPRVITDKTRTHEFVRVGLLGEVSLETFDSDVVF